LTANRIIYGAIAFMAAAFVVLSENRATYAALYAVLLLPLISLAVLLVSGRRVSVTEKLEAATVRKGEPAQYIISAANNGFCSFRATVVFSKKLRRLLKISEPAYSGAIFLPPRRAGEAVFEMRAEYRGVFNVSADYIIIYDWLGLFKIRVKTLGQSKLTVLPDIRGLENLPVSLSNPADITAAEGLAEDYADFPDLQKYSPSDGHKRIHWQMSAKRGELISKNYNAAEKSSAAVIIDNSGFPANIRQSETEKMRCEDAIIEAAVAVMFHCVSVAALPVRLDYIGGQPESPSLDFDYLYASAAGIEFDGGENFGDFLAGIASDIAEMRRGADNIYIFTKFTGKIAESVADCVKSLRASGRNAEIFYYDYNYDCTERECKTWQETTETTG